jgi:hypothetical protein
MDRNPSNYLGGQGMGPIMPIYKPPMKINPEMNPYTPPPYPTNEYNPMITPATNIQQQYDENDKELEKIVMYIINLRNHEKREEALHELSKKRESFTALAPILWHSVGTLAIL